ADSIYGGAGNDYVEAGDGDDYVDGSLGDDNLLGGAGKDSLFGGAGNDTLSGGVGQDMLYGGGGANRFVFLQLADSTLAAADSIADFNFAGGDRIDLSGIDARSAVAGDQAFAWMGNAAFSGAGQLHYGAAIGGGYAISGDVNGDLVADFAIMVNAGTAPIGGWFIL
ncbi:MAG: M10 family metallopeptidase C-terminal domain-containing protein, partial [Roseococcus sp.]